MKSNNVKSSAEQFDELESKDRVYMLKGNSKPLSYTLNCRHSKGNPLLYFDPVKKENRALRYCPNQRSPFIDEQDGNAILDYVAFEDGKLVVEAENRVLQKLLFIHPKRDLIFYEFDKTIEAKNQVKQMDLEDEARDAARQLTIKQIEDILRVCTTANVDNMTSEELKRDIRLYARQYPKEFLEAVNDPQLQMENTVSKLLTRGVIQCRNGKDVHLNLETNKKKLFTLLLGAELTDAIIQYFLTDEGLEIFKVIESKVD